MKETGVRKIVESGNFEWAWETARGLLIISGADGGGGGGGGAFSMQELNLCVGEGGEGGVGGGPTTVEVGGRTHGASGGAGGGGGGGAGINNGKPARGKDGAGCHYGDIHGGLGARGSGEDQDSGKILAEGGNGGRGFPGETRIVELDDLTVGADFKVDIGQGGRGGRGAPGYVEGKDGSDGNNGCVVLVPIFGG